MQRDPCNNIENCNKFAKDEINNNKVIRPNELISHSAITFERLMYDLEEGQKAIV
jgi:hypothetical protein